jgi:hypothetical protein
MKKYTVTLLLVVLLLTSISVAAAADGLVRVRLVPVGDSGVRGRVTLAELRSGGTGIVVVARGLVPGVEYTSLYYDNHTCELEPYEEDDVIGTYTADAEGIGRTQGSADDELDEINSVSVRRVSDFELLSCADVHPGE